MRSDSGGERASALFFSSFLLLVRARLVAMVRSPGVEAAEEALVCVLSMIV